MSNYNLLDLSQITNFGPGPICSATEASLFEETSSKRGGVKERNKNGERMRRGKKLLNSYYNGGARTRSSKDRRKYF
jgi:hypothetical protein